jgi:hypothetical protein
MNSHGFHHGLAYISSYFKPLNNTLFSSLYNILSSSPMYKLHWDDQNFGTPNHSAFEFFDLINILIW